MKVRMTTAMIAAGCAVSMVGTAQAQAIKTEPPMKEFSESEIAEIPMPELEFEYASVDADNFEKYFYFHREDTSFSVAYADILECDSLGSGINYYLSGNDAAMNSAIAQYGFAGAIGGAIGAALADAIFGSAERRRLKRINIRNCMFYKGYDRYGLEKDLWQEFHFEEGLNRENAEDREAALLQQARVASGPKPTTEVLAP